MSEVGFDSRSASGFYSRVFFMGEDGGAPPVGAASGGPHWLPPGGHSDRPPPAHRGAAGRLPPPLPVLRLTPSPYLVPTGQARARLVSRTIFATAVLLQRAAAAACICPCCGGCHGLLRN
ncbi:putative homeobox protein knotted-1-like 3 [Iris pallida]|uniref:Homeobox protein knotted-1-like 3 n=1 Tax=Iris pallida TaxID=29817 RepID=A0AAX6GLJ7_IRIPA|nr:putative homeobox protein knotted-1-like 3 [Iris pallida]